MKTMIVILFNDENQKYDQSGQLKIQLFPPG